MKLNINWKKVILVVADVLIAAYLVVAVTSWNKPSEQPVVCSKVEIHIEDENENGFLKTAEVKSLLERKKLYPLSRNVKDVNIREIEETLLKTAFVKTAQCYVAQNGHVYISLTQRTPIVRVKASNGDDYYIDDNGGVMPNSQYTSDMIIITGSVSRQYACKYLSVMAEYIMTDKFWHNQIEQINVLADKTVEIIPRVGDHIVNIGMLPTHSNDEKRKEMVTAFVEKQLHRLELFYKYGLSHAGWNKYSYISLEFANQVICTRPETGKKPVAKPAVKTDKVVEQPESANEKTQENTMQKSVPATVNQEPLKAKPTNSKR